MMQTFSPHRGAVRTLLYSNNPTLCSGYTGDGLLFSGSEDRTIKVWEVWAEKSMEETCKQTLVGHGSTVTAIVERAGALVSCSTDGTVRVWRPEKGRELLTRVYLACSPFQARRQCSAEY